MQEWQRPRTCGECALGCWVQFDDQAMVVLECSQDGRIILPEWRACPLFEEKEEEDDS